MYLTQKLRHEFPKAFLQLRISYLYAIVTSFSLMLKKYITIW